MSCPTSCGRSATRVWHGAAEGLAALLGSGGRILLADAGLYNAAKHGLAVIPGKSGFTLGDPDEPSEPSIKVDGPSLSYLDLDGERGEKQWQKSTAWISPESNLSLAFLASQQIENLWKVARARYIGAPGVNLSLPSPEMVEKCLTAGRGDDPIQVHFMHESLLYYADVQAGGAKRQA